MSGNLNPRDHRALYEFMPDITRVMYQVLSESGASFNAIASVPTGGNEYADALQAVIERVEHRKVPRVFLNKNRLYQAYERTAATPGSKVLVVDDCVCSGHELGLVEKSLRSAGFEVGAHIVVADLNFKEERPISVPVLSAFSSKYLRDEGIWL